MFREDRVSGAVVGSAVGDALGAPFEFMREGTFSTRFLAPIAQALEGRGVLADARAAGLGVFASAPLHGGQVPELFTPELIDLIAPGGTPAQAALTVVGSAPGVRRVLISTGNQEHWQQAVAALDGPVLSRDQLQRITNVLGT
jgi:aryl-alcohol dehydrogenase-like predicted oxidoreductase